MFSYNSDDEDGEESLIPVNRNYARPSVEPSIPSGTASCTSDEDENSFLESGKTSPPNYSSSFSHISFLHKKPTSAENSTIAEQTVIAAGCSEAAIHAVEKLSLSDLYDGVVELPPKDDSLLNDQLERDSVVNWDSTSIYTGLGVDESGSYTGLSLIRLSELMASVNNQLCVMQREMGRHRIAIEQSQKSGMARQLGFEDKGNRMQLNRMSASTVRACNGLAENVIKLRNSIQGKEVASPSFDYGQIAFATVTICIIALLGKSVVKLL